MKFKIYMLNPIIKQVTIFSIFLINFTFILHFKLCIFLFKSTTKPNIKIIPNNIIFNIVRILRNALFNLRNNCEKKSIVLKTCYISNISKLVVKEIQVAICLEHSRHQSHYVIIAFIDIKLT